MAFLPVPSERTQSVLLLVFYAVSFVAWLVGPADAWFPWLCVRAVALTAFCHVVESAVFLVVLKRLPLTLESVFQMTVFGMIWALPRMEEAKAAAEAGRANMRSR
jgi:hypothetical protein